MKITPKVLSIPPFISTMWKNIQSIHMEGFDTDGPIVIISLTNGNRVELPPLDPPIVEAIFTAHAQYMSDVTTKASQARASESITTQLFPPFPLSAFSIDTSLKHNPSQIDMPDIPQEIVDKLSSIAKAMGIDDSSLLPEAEPNCNCIHCQISRAIRNEKKQESVVIEEEEITAEDLRFRVWDVTQTGNELYLVSNPLDTQENYHVCLGDAVGCSCGQKNCEHIKAVLST